jgi:hypothetical protein
MKMETNQNRNNRTLAIHHRKGSLSEHWVQYCEEKNIHYKIVNCYDSDIIAQLEDCYALMWHWHFGDYRAQNFARQLIASVHNKGLKVFPDYNTCWHYDDKVGQKYLLESIGAPIIPTYVFYDKRNALEWTKITSYPKVFKLRGGAGSSNVKLVKSKAAAVSYIKRAFRGGFRSSGKLSNFRQRIWRVRRDRDIHSLIHLLKGIVRIIIPGNNPGLLPVQKGYVYFQDYIPDMNYDIRVVIIHDKAFAMKRWNRKNDFRASGSGIKSYKPQDIDTRFIEAAFNLNKRLNAQSIAFDFALENDEIKVIEISYAFVTRIFPGYWDTDLQWNAGEINIAHLIIDNLLNEK